MPPFIQHTSATLQTFSGGMSFDQAFCIGSGCSPVRKVTLFHFIIKVLSPEGEGLMTPTKLYRNFFKEEIHLRTTATEKNDDD